MSNITFENYGKQAQYGKDNTIIGGRYFFQKESEKKIVKDLIKKLDLNPEDKCLEIGCGTGNLLIPISFFVKSICGIDNKHCIDKLNLRFSGSDNIDLIKGNFFDIKLNDSYNKIIVYSVLHYLEDEGHVLKFIDKCLELISPFGKILLGDLPNISLKKRFLNSDIGKNIIKDFNEKLKNIKPSNSADNELKHIIKKDDKLVIFNDNLILKILSYIREKGFDAYLLPQPTDLAFGYTREDILINRRY